MSLQLKSPRFDTKLKILIVNPLFLVLFLDEYKQSGRFLAALFYCHFGFKDSDHSSNISFVKTFCLCYLIYI